MKISYRTHPILEKLFNRDFATVEEVAIIKKHYKAFIDNIQFITNPFANAIEKSYEKFNKEDLFKEIKGVTGLFIEGNLSFFYDIKDYENFEIMMFTGQHCITILYCENAKLNFHIKNELLLDTKYEPLSLVKFLQAEVLVKLLFINYVEVETKNIPSKTTVKGFDCKYVNDTKLPIKILNSHYYTNLYVTGAFNVRGHWRWSLSSVKSGNFLCSLSAIASILFVERFTPEYLAFSRALNVSNMNRKELV